MLPSGSVTGLALEALAFPSALFRTIFWIYTCVYFSPSHFHKINYLSAQSATLQALATYLEFVFFWS